MHVLNCSLLSYIQFLRLESCPFSITLVFLYHFKYTGLYHCSFRCLFFYFRVKTMSSIGKQNMRFCMPSKMQNCSIDWNISQETAFRFNWLLITYSRWKCHTALLSALRCPCVSGNNLSTHKHRSLSAHYLINKVMPLHQPGPEPSCHKC